MTKPKSKASLLLFWDYDTQWGADRSRSAGGPKEWGPLEFTNTDRLLDLHAQYDVPACFAVVGAAALNGERPYHDQDQIRRIHQAGHEVGSHAFKHEWLPGLNQLSLKESLRNSKDAIEQCIGAPVYTFVPPYNQPRDYARGSSFSISERREAGKGRTTLLGLCEALRGTGYRFCRVSYRPLQQRLSERIMRRRLDQPSKSEEIAGITCIRLNTPGGFDQPAVDMLERCATDGGTAVVYGHPHAIKSRTSQNESFLESFLKRVAELRECGILEVALPAQFYCGESLS
jgi:hypothetical protein